MDIRLIEVSKGFVYLHFKENGYGLFIDQFEAFGSLLLKTGSNVGYDAETASICYERDGKERKLRLAQLSFAQARAEEKSHAYLKSVISDCNISFGTEISSVDVGEQQLSLLKLRLWDMSCVTEFELHASRSFSDLETASYVPFILPKLSESKQTKVKAGDFVDTHSDSCITDQSCDVALSDIDSIHPKVMAFLRSFPAFVRELLPLERNEVLDYLTLSPIVLVREEGKLYCVAGIQSYVQAVNTLDKKQKVPVRWFTGKMGLALKRLNTMEVLGLPIIYSTKKSLLQQTFDTLQPSFSPLYKQSFFASCSSKKFAALFGLDARTIQEISR